MKLFQNLVYQIKETIDIEFGITDETGLILGCSNESKLGSIHPSISCITDSKNIFNIVDGVTFQKVYVKNKLELIIFINSEDSNSRKYLSLISINATNIKIYFEEKFDKNNFFKYIILDNILQGDILLKARELHLSLNVFRTVFLIKTDVTRDIYSNEIILSLFPNRLKDFVIVLDDESTVLIKELKSGDDHKDIDRTAKIIIDTLNTEMMVKAQIGIGSIVDNIRDVGRSFKEAQTALQVGSIFENDKAIFYYNNLGIGRLINQLPTSLCKIFLKEVFNRGSFESLDTETLFTIQKFFENNLNVSETSRQLYVHRNTLVYRLDKIQKVTGLDLRKFEDAIIFKVSMLVKRYLDKTEKLV